MSPSRSSGVARRRRTTGWLGTSIGSSHPAALVNHMLDYEYLFGPNVAGTAELVGPGAHPPPESGSTSCRRWPPRGWSSAAGVVDEDSPFARRSRSAVTTAPGMQPASGLPSTCCTVPTAGSASRSTCSAGDMMLPHSRYHEQVNVPDIFIRLLHSIVTTGLAPASFYELEADGSRPERALRRPPRRLRRRRDRRHQRTGAPTTSGRSTSSTTTKTTASHWTPSSTGSTPRAIQWSGSDPP